MLLSTCGFPKSFKALKRAVLFGSNRFSSDAQKRFMGSGLRVDFKKPGKIGQLNGMLTEIDISVFLGCLKLLTMMATANVFSFLALL